MGKNIAKFCILFFFVNTDRGEIRQIKLVRWYLSSIIMGFLLERRKQSAFPLSQNSKKVNTFEIQANIT